MENIEKIKTKYKQLKQKYPLPEFEQLAQDFDIEKIAEKESSFLLREIRKAIIEKITAYMQLIETFLNPSSPPMFIFTILKNLEAETRKSMKQIYKEFAKLQLQAIKLDAIYSEEKEAGFIIQSQKIWQKIKRELYKLLEQFEKKFEQEANSEKRSYFR